MKYVKDVKRHSQKAIFCLPSVDNPYACVFQCSRGDLHPCRTGFKMEYVLQCISQALFYISRRENQYIPDKFRIIWVKLERVCHFLIAYPRNRKRERKRFHLYPPIKESKRGVTCSYTFPWKFKSRGAETEVINDLEITMHENEGTYKGFGKGRKAEECVCLKNLFK